MALKLLTEFVEFKSFDILTEGEDKRTLKISGPFLEANVKNRNSRIYSRELCEREVLELNKKIKANQCVGELDHPESPAINLDRVSHKIESLVMEGNKGMGIAKILNTPMGKIARTLIEEDIVLGVSTRGIGSVSNDGKVNENFKLLTIDIVANPSAPNSFVDGILENKEYIMNGNNIVECAINEMKTTLDKQGSKVVLEVMQTFLNRIK